MGKPSSSSRKKRSKYSSLDRGGKRSKTKKAKLKKLRRQDDSGSYSSDDSRSLTSVSLSSEDSYRGRKSRSSTRKDVTATKRARSQSSSSKESFRLRKSKGSRRKVDSEVRKKTLKHKKKNKNKNKKSRRNGTGSCSTCQSSCDSSDESEYESHRGRSKKRGNDIKSLKNVKSKSKKRRYRSISCSSHSRDCDSDYCREEKVTDGNISKRLRSVITFTKDDKEESKLDKNKDEVIYEDDGSPSGRNNDSYGGRNKMNSGNQSPVASEKERSVENGKKDSSDIIATEPSCRSVGGDDQSVEGKPASDGIRTNDSLGKRVDEIAEACDTVHDDLETLLRQKALENLKRFRGGMQINTRNNATREDESCTALKSPCPTKADVSQNDPKDECTRVVEGDSVHSLQEEKILDGKIRGNGSASVVNKVFLTSKVGVGKRDKVNMTAGLGINRQRLVTSALKQALSNCTTNAVAAPKVNLVSGSGLGELDGTSESGKINSEKINHASGSASAKFSTCPPSEGRDTRLNILQDEDKQSSQMEERTAKLQEPLSSTLDGDTVNNAPGSDIALPSYVASAAQNINSSEEKADGEESSPLKQKTMSVMRGGEMVQVSYKVYIPKKAPALARRQLKR